MCAQSLGRTGAALWMELRVSRLAIHQPGVTTVLQAHGEDLPQAGAMVLELRFDQFEEPRPHAARRNQQRIEGGSIGPAGQVMKETHDIGDEIRIAKDLRG